MRLGWLLVLALPVSLAACGGSPTSSTVSVTCSGGGGVALAGATSVDVTPGANGSAVLSFPDPVNKGRTGTIPIAPGGKCTVGPTHDVVS